MLMWCRCVHPAQRRYRHFNKVMPDMDERSNSVDVLVMGRWLGIEYIGS